MDEPPILDMHLRSKHVDTQEWYVHIHITQRSSNKFRAKVVDEPKQILLVFEFKFASSKLRVVVLVFKRGETGTEADIYHQALPLIASAAKFSQKISDISNWKVLANFATFIVYGLHVEGSIMHSSLEEILRAMICIFCYADNSRLNLKFSVQEPPADARNWTTHEGNIASYVRSK